MERFVENSWGLPQDMCPMCLHIEFLNACVVQGGGMILYPHCYAGYSRCSYTVNSTPSYQPLFWSLIRGPKRVSFPRWSAYCLHSKPLYYLPNIRTPSAVPSRLFQRRNIPVISFFLVTRLRDVRSDASCQKNTSEKCGHVLP